MPLHIGDQAPDAVRLAGVAVDRVYQGGNLVWPPAPETYRYQFLGFGAAPAGQGQGARNYSEWNFHKTDLDGNTLPPPNLGTIYELSVSGARNCYWEWPSDATDQGTSWRAAFTFMNHDWFSYLDNQEVVITVHEAPAEVDWTWRFDGVDISFTSRYAGNAGPRPSWSDVIFDELDRGGTDRLAGVALWTPGNTLTMTGLLSGESLTATLSSWSSPRWFVNETWSGYPVWAGHAGEPCRFTVA